MNLKVHLLRLFWTCIY